MNIGEEGGFGGDGFAHAIWLDRAVVATKRTLMQPKAGFAILGDELFLIGRLQVANGTVAITYKLCGMFWSDTVQEGGGMWGEKSGGLIGAEDGKAARLVEVAGGLGEEFVRGQADRNADADILLNVERKPCKGRGWRAAIDLGGARKVEIGLINGDDLHKRGEGAHFLTDL